MNYKKEFQRMMQLHTKIALSTAVNETPNVRIVNFYYDSDKQILYFSSFFDNQKVNELAQNPHIAFTTVTDNSEEHVRVKNGICNKSTFAIEEMKENFLKKLPDYIMSVPGILPELILYEVTFCSAEVVLDVEHAAVITL